jgi:hypothetical protein
MQSSHWAQTKMNKSTHMKANVFQKGKGLQHLTLLSINHKLQAIIKKIQ